MGLIEVKLRPTGPWRAGHRAGDRERVDVIFHSDQLFSAITHAMRVLGWMDEWLADTARATSPAVRFSSLFPYVGKTRLITQPRSGKLAPLNRERQPDQQPYTVSVRSAAAVDRLTGAIEPHRIACLEFAPNAGMWGVFEATPEWEPKVKAAFRLLADSGFGGERGQGWGRSRSPSSPPRQPSFRTAPPTATGGCSEPSPPPPKTASTGPKANTPSLSGEAGPTVPPEPPKRNRSA